MMIVSIVMPETGLRAVVAIAFAATDAKKNEKASVEGEADRTAVSVEPSVPEEDRRRRVRRGRRRGGSTISEMSRSVRSDATPSPCGTPCAAIANDPATILSDFRMPKIPAVAMAPTPT